MKYISGTILFLFLVVSTIYAQGPSCCMSATSATDEFAMFSHDESFRSAHENPLPFTLADAKGEMITFKTSDGKTGSAYYVKSDSTTKKTIIIFHEWWGLNDYIKQQADSIAKTLGNVNVYAVDLYDGKVATDKEAAAEYMGAVTEERATNIIKGVISHAGKNAEIGTIGWCFGGGWSLQAALLGGSQVKACVMYYGMPEKDSTKLTTLSAPVLGIFAMRDTWITNEMVAEFQQLMTDAGKTFDMKIYNADHAFANPSNPQYDKSNAEHAFTSSMDYFKQHLIATSTE